ncbi:hypothetical protein EDD86DRAFT_204486 [Gorgonomyces haynaldii]|nr:hypothetical protein EDD86DRAFT_204486 [Gorgonomyces haynaldii]
MTPQAKHILIPMDESQSAENALSFCIDHLATPEDTLVLLHVRPFPENLVVEAALGMPSAAVDHDYRMDMDKTISIDFLKKTQERIVKRGFQAETESLCGHPPDVILDRIKRSPPSMVVCGHRGLNSLERVFLGSVSEQLVHHSPVPVLIVRK